MIPVEDLTTFDFDKVPVDDFWNTGSTKEQKMHRIHAYPAKFPAFITSKALEYAKSAGLKVNSVADIFCGCGTTAFEAKRNKISFWGCDINPVATLIAKTKSRKYQQARLISYYNLISEEFKRAVKVKPGNYKFASERLAYWFPKKQYEDLYLLREAILSNTSSKSPYRQFFLCAFSNILKPASMWLTKSIKPQIDPYKNPGKVATLFDAQFDLMLSANAENEQHNSVKSTIITGSFLDEGVFAPKVDMIITSPPYVTSYEYADLHQLSSLWLGYVDDYRELRDGTIGSLHHDYNFDRELKRLNETGYKVVTQLLSCFRSKARSVAKYFLDMQGVAEKSYSLVEPGGIAVFVIGNTEYKSIKIDNAKHLSESLLSSGFTELSVTKRKISNKILTPYRDGKGKFTSTSTGRKVYSEEFIVIARK